MSSNLSIGQQIKNLPNDITMENMIAAIGHAIEKGLPEKSSWKVTALRTASSLLQLMPIISLTKNLQEDNYPISLLSYIPMAIMIGKLSGNKQAGQIVGVMNKVQVIGSYLLDVYYSQDRVINNIADLFSALELFNISFDPIDGSFRCADNNLSEPHY